MSEGNLGTLLQIRDYDSTKRKINLTYAEGITMEQLFSDFATECHTDWITSFNNIGLACSLTPHPEMPIEAIAGLERIYLPRTGDFNFKESVREIYQLSNKRGLKIKGFSFFGNMLEEGDFSQNNLVACFEGRDNTYITIEDRIRRKHLKAFFTQETLDTLFPLRKNDSNGEMNGK